MIHSFVKHQAMGTICLSALASMGLLFTNASVSAQLGVTTDGGANVLTYHNDAARTGQNTNENKLFWRTVNPSNFARLYTRKVDGKVYAQPLYVSDLMIPEPGTGQVRPHNVVFIATANNNIYAFDAESDKGVLKYPYWTTTFNFPDLEIIPVPSVDINPDLDTAPNLGIVGTPTIAYDPNSSNPDERSGTLFVLVRNRQVNDYFQYLHALDLTTGEDKPGSPVLVEASVTGIGDGSDGSNNLAFDTLWQNQPSGLLYQSVRGDGETTNDHGLVTVAWGGHQNVDPYHGWVMKFSYDSSKTDQAFHLESVANTSADANRAGIQVAPSADPQGNVYVTTGNDVFNPDAGIQSFSNSVLKLDDAFNMTSYFTPHNQATLSLDNQDLSTGGVLIVPDYNPNLRRVQPSHKTHPRICIGAGLEGALYVMDRDSLGGFNENDDSQIKQVVRDQNGGIYGMPAYFNNKIYTAGVGDVPKAFSLIDSSLSKTPVSVAPDARKFQYPGGTPTVTAFNGVYSGIVWVNETFYPPRLSVARTGRPPFNVLHAYNALDMTQELYSSMDMGNRDKGSASTRLPNTVTVANGRVFVAGNNEVSVYGINSNPGTAKADHFLMLGPMWHPWLFFPFMPYLEDHIGYNWSISAFDAENKRINLNEKVTIGLFDGAVTKYVGTEPFNNQSIIVMNRFLRDPGFAFEWVVTDEPGLNKVFPLQILADIGNNLNQGTDHFSLRAVRSARVGQTIFMTIQSLTFTNSPVDYNGFVLIYNTNPDGTQVDVPLNPDFTFRSDFGYEDQYGLLTLPFLMRGSVKTAPIVIRHKGPNIFMVTDGFVTGSIVVNGQ